MSQISFGSKRAVMLVLLMMMLAFCAEVLADATAMPEHHHDHSATLAQGTDTSLLGRLFENYVPRQQCMFYESDVIWTHVAADSIIGLAYYSIPIALIYFIRKRKDLVFNWVFYFFAAFILLCGTTHFFSVLAIWHPYYRLDGYVKALTAIVSIGTAFTLWPLIPKALLIPSQTQLQHANLQLEAEVVKTRKAEEELLAIRDGLEVRVQERTTELASANESLRAEALHRQKMEQEREELLRSERAAREEAERANRMKDEFLATLSHELRTPINSIYGWTQLLRSGKAATAEDLTEGLSVIERNTKVQARLIDDLLDMSRIISGKIQLEIQRVELVSVIESAIETIRPAADGREIRIGCTFDPFAGPIMGDPNRLQQVVWNLLSNAVKFSPKGTRIQIHLERVNSHVEIIVQDQGPGIPQDLLPHLFERFRQGDSSATRRHGGLGLGLAIVKNIVEMHGGSVRVHSEGEGKGSTFLVALPLMPVRDEVQFTPPRDAGSWLPTGRASLDGLTVLVVDDESDGRKIVRRALEDHGATVLEAVSAAEALLHLQNLRPHVLVSDIGMPDEDGYSLIRKIRARSPASGGLIPAIALTAFARTEDRMRTLNAGFQVHLNKPVEIYELVTVVANMARLTRTN